MTAPASNRFKPLLNAETWSELRERLKRLESEVPWSRNEREKQQLELWVLKHALLTSDAEKALCMLQPPFAWWQGDKPDFWVSLAKGSVGIEVAEVTSELVAWSATLAQEHALSVYFMPRPSDFEGQPSKDALLQVLPEGRGTRPWTGYEPEEEFAELVCDRIGKKIKKTNGYAKSDHSLLLLYNNSGLPLWRNLLEKSGVLGQIRDCVRRAAVFTTVAILLDLGGGPELIAFNR